ncbi:MAG: PTS sugar transporter subunit IIA [Clostridium sp.]
MGLFKFGKVKEEEIYAPAVGKIINIEEVDDVTFAKKMIGDGIAIEPKDGVIYSPCDGEIVSLMGTLHAIGIKSKCEAELLLHVGIDTVNMKGDGFKAFVREGEKVKKGQKLLEIDLEKIRKNAKSDNIILLLTNEDIEIDNISRKGESSLDSIVMNLKRK